MNDLENSRIGPVGRLGIALAMLTAPIVLILSPGGLAMAQSAGGSSGGSASASGASSGGTGSGGASVGGSDVGSGSASTSLQTPTAPSPVSPSVTSGARSLSGGGSRNAAEAGLAQENIWDLGGDATNAANGVADGAGGGTSSATQAAATAGDTSINSINAGSVATSGNPGTASATGATTIAGSTGTAGGVESSRIGTAGRIGNFSPGAGRPEDYRIPKPPVAVDLATIRSALADGPSATPDGEGN